MGKKRRSSNGEKVKENVTKRSKESVNVCNQSHKRRTIKPRKTHCLRKLFTRFDLLTHAVVEFTKVGKKVGWLVGWMDGKLHDWYLASSLDGSLVGSFVG